MKNKGIWILIWVCVLFGAIPAYSQLKVWPGDANNDGIVNHLDLLHIGATFGSQGIARDSVSIHWVEEDAAPWNDRLPDSLNYAFSDCNGNGFINGDDVLVVDENYGKRHGNTLVDSFPQGNSQSPPLYLAYFADSAQPGGAFNMYVTLGNPAQRIDSIFGIAFTLVYDTTKIKPNTVMAYLKSQWMGTPNDLPIFIYKNHPADGKLDVAISLKARSGGNFNNNASGYGNIAQVSFIIEDNLIGKTTANVDIVFRFENVRMMTKSFGKKLLYYAPDTLKVLTTGISDKYLDEQFNIFPNPVADQLQIMAGKIAVTEATLYNSMGQAVLYHPAFTNKAALRVNHLPNGVYILLINTENGVITKKILVYN